MKTSKTKFIYLVLGLLFVTSLSAQIVGVRRGGQENNPENLSDKDKYVSENYIHEGYLERQKQEECAGDNKKACAGMDVGNQSVKMIAKAFGMIVGMLPGDGSFKAEVKTTGSTPAQPQTPPAGGEAGTAGNNGDAAKPKEENRQDYCRYIAVGTEMVAQFQQQATQTEMSSIPVKKETAQKESLDRAARSHESRAKNSEYQVVGWGATTVCYGYMAATSSSVGTMGWVKLGMAGVMTGFYMSEVKKHKDAAKKVRDIASKLDGAGDCNPVTEKNCYCGQPETMNDVTVCMPQIRKRQIAANSVQVACMDNKLNPDPQCNCVSTDTCYDKEFINNINGLNFGEGFNQGVTGPLRKISRGELAQGNMSGSAFRQAALAKQAMRNIKPVPFDKELTKAQKEEALALTKMGLPASVAGTVAATKISPSALQGVRSRLGTVNYSGYKGNRAYRGGSRNRVLSFSGSGDGLNGPRRKGSSSGVDFNKFLKKGKRGARGGKVLDFRDKASRSGSAQISKDTSRSVFDIVSRRYMISGWGRLELD
ncbi:MAG: hypothetical protein EP319_12855 [Deltaproteobacteria bacterium]|nr:MAG: hypothetical protein EP319_12855 [Deltaproteobacteria bacterium]